MRLQRSLVIGTAAAISVLGLTGTAQAHDGGGHHGADRAQVIKVEDDCETASFDAEFEPGTCVGDGDTTFDEFFAEFQATGAVDGWEFDPYWVRIDQGQSIKADNVGGEFHTFTRVRHFGDACVPLLNLGKQPVIAECTPPDGPVAGELFGLTGIAPGGELTFTSEGVEPVGDDNPGGVGPKGFEQTLQPGKNRFECLIHPWMRAVVVVDEDDDHGNSGHH
jgi:hypothetical protein